MSLLQRHRMVHAALGEEMRECIHALTMTAQTPAEWESHPIARESPACRGASVKQDRNQARQEPG
jgi:mRNA-degrading endonuclease YafQ of YafQ-DinJ toxin-antitoxin module